VVPVTGLSGEIRGALVVDGARHWGDTERGLVAGFAQHLGSALDLQALRERLTVSSARQAEVRHHMLVQGIQTLNLCPRCGRCFDQTRPRCEADGAELDGTRLLPYRVHDRYLLLRLLGEGGMGSVFACRDERLDRDVALKVIHAERLLDSQTRFRLEREARALASVDHPSVVGLFDSGELEDGSAFLVMELVDGTSVADLLLNHGPATPAQAATLVAQVGSALAAAHRAGVVHRDVKPANIVIAGGGQAPLIAKVLDFGVAKSARTDTRLTRTGAIMGTPAYMSPEQVEGGDVDGRSDLYSLAVVAFEALTGRRLVEGAEGAKQMIEVLYGTHPAVSSFVAVPDGVDAAFDKALAKRPEDRPDDIEAWSRGLAGLLADAAASTSGWPVAPRGESGP
jgi:serine/threonine protein kinase